MQLSTTTDQQRLQASHTIRYLHNRWQYYTGTIGALLLIFSIQTRGQENSHRTLRSFSGVLHWIKYLESIYGPIKNIRRAPYSEKHPKIELADYYNQFLYNS